MDEFKYRAYSVSIRMSNPELDRPRRLRDPIWRSVLVGVGILRPRYGKTLREGMAERMDDQYRNLVAFAAGSLKDSEDRGL